MLQEGGTAMPFELLHFRDSDKILKKKRMEKDIQATLEYIDLALSGFLYKRELLRQVLDEMGWKAEECVAFEDSENGCLSARRADLPVIITVNAYTRDESFTGASLVLDQLGDPDVPVELIDDPQGAFKDTMLSIDYLISNFG